eukprot:TRINITY_DN2655_c0_g1_i12.p5 TRINITY_DN2655_c0_g1~~TRINITY_DN2655_c0_g1_i12.p5  ORF type:complete len:101 (+),score=1.45 TRINITY_DN2655_c0_g1_i12:994-1296(+)
MLQAYKQLRVIFLRNQKNMRLNLETRCKSKILLVVANFHDGQLALASIEFQLRLSMCVKFVDLLNGEVNNQPTLQLSTICQFLIIVTYFCLFTQVIIVYF